MPNKPRKVGDKIRVSMQMHGGDIGSAGVRWSHANGNLHHYSHRKFQLRLDHTDALREFDAGGEVNAHLLRRPARILAAK
jgi:hypothetical protein